MRKLTRQQEAILYALEEADGPLAPAELLEAASRRCPGLGLATVYRALKKLVASGQARKIEAAGCPPHYERLGGDHHHFFVCESCRRIFDLEGCSGGLRRLLPTGFKMTSHEIILYGACKECSSLTLAAGSPANSNEKRTGSPIQTLRRVRGVKSAECSARKK